MRLTSLLLVILVLAGQLVSAPASAATKTELIELAERGWQYQYRNSFRRQVAKIPASHVLAKTMPARTICLLGDAPHALTLDTLDAFRSLIGRVFGDVGTMSQSVASTRDCPQDASVFIRLYSRRLPNAAFNDDLQILNQRFAIGMTDQPQQILSPAQAVTFFGRKGQATHIVLLQPWKFRLTPLQERFFRSLLIEELYQTYSFGIDVFKVGRGGPYLSKLQESFINLMRLDWTSEAYMEGLLSSNPSGLCQFDLMMLHAIDAVPASVSASAGFVAFVSQNYEQLLNAARRTEVSAQVSHLVDPSCNGATPDITAQ